MTAFKELDVVRLKSAIPGGGGWTDDLEVPAGAVGTIVHVHEPRYEVEFTDADGKTLRVASVLEHDLEAEPMANIKERETVRLARDWLATVTFPKGYTGTVVHVHPSGGYEVEFTDGEGRRVLLGLPSAMVEKVDYLATQAFERWNAAFMGNPIGDVVDEAITTMQVDGMPIPSVEMADNLKRALAALVHKSREAWLQNQPIARPEPVRIHASERIRNSRPLGNVLRAAETVANEWWLGTIPTDEALERLHKAISDNNEVYNAMTRCDRCGQVICECDATVKP